MKYFPFYFTLFMFLSGCGGGGSSTPTVSDTTDTTDITDRSARKTASEDDAKANARAVRAYFYRDGGASSRKLQKRNETAEPSSSVVSCANDGIVITDFFEQEGDNIFGFAQVYSNCKGDDGHIYNGATGGLLGFSSDEEEEGLVTATLYNEFSIKYNNAFTSQSFGTMPFSPASQEDFYNLNVEFSTKVDKVNFSGGYFNELTVKSANSKTITTLKSYIDPEYISFYSIIGEDSTGTEWTKLNISYREEDDSNNQENYRFEFSIDTEKTIISKKCSNQYKTTTPKAIRFSGDGSVTGEMIFYNKTDDVRTKLRIIDSKKIELSADFDNDGTPDYKEILSWEELFGASNESQELDSYNICR